MIMFFVLGLKHKEKKFPLKTALLSKVDPGKSSITVFSKDKLTFVRPQVQMLLNLGINIQE